MAENEFNFQPVTHITIDAIGPAGQRVFYIQAHQNRQVITLIIEKVQVQSMGLGAEQFLAELQQKFPDLAEADDAYVEADMRIHPPVDPLFRVGELGLGYDAEQDQIVLIAKELIADEQAGEPQEELPDERQEELPDERQEEQQDEQGKVVRFWCTRSQLRAMCKWGSQVAALGRPICPQCGEPMDPAGHFCPKRNGHKH